MDKHGRVLPWSPGEYLIGNSVQVRVVQEHLGTTKANRYIELASDPGNAEFQLLDDELQESYNKPLLPAIDAAGLPRPGTKESVTRRQGASSNTYMQQYVALSDALYHGGEGGLNQMSRILAIAQGGEDGKRQAIVMLEDSSFYQQSGPARAEKLKRAVTSL